VERKKNGSTKAAGSWLRMAGRLKYGQATASSGRGKFSASSPQNTLDWAELK